MSLTLREENQMRLLFIALATFLVSCKTVDSNELSGVEVVSTKVFCVVAPIGNLNAAAPFLAECSELELARGSQNDWSGYLSLQTKVDRARFSAYDQNEQQLGSYSYNTANESLGSILDKLQSTDLSSQLRKEMWRKEGDFSTGDVKRLELITIASAHNIILYHSADKEPPLLTLGPLADPSPQKPQGKFNVIAYPEIEDSYALALGQDFPTGETLLALAARADEETKALIDEIAEIDFIKYLNDELSERERQNRIFILYWKERETLDQLAQKLNQILTKDK